MSTPLYNAELLRLATSIPHHKRLAEPMGSSEKRSPICGSRVAVDVDLDEAGRVGAIGLKVRACALGQASSSLMASHALGRRPEDLTAARDALARWLTEGGDTPDWPGIVALDPARPHTARHASIRLAFEAAAEAAETAARVRAG